MNREESLKRIVDWYHNTGNRIYIKPFEEGNYLLGVTYGFDVEDGYMVPVETGGRTLHCQAVGRIPRGTPVMIVVSEESEEIEK